MELKPYDVKNILSNIELVLKTANIEKLSKKSYGFISIMCGFIAHYDLSGFQAHYAELQDLIEKLKGSLPIEKDTCLRDVNDKPKYNGYGLPYCQSKLDIVEGIEKLVAKYETSIMKKAGAKNDDRWELLKESVKRAEKDEQFRDVLIAKLF